MNTNSAVREAQSETILSWIGKGSLKLTKEEYKSLNNYAGLTRTDVRKAVDRLEQQGEVSVEGTPEGVTVKRTNDPE